MKRKAILLSVMVGALLVAVAGVAWAATIQCDGEGDSDPDPGQCTGTNSGDVITGTTNADIIKALGSGNQVDQVMARGGRDKVLGGNGADFLFGGGGNDTLNAGPNLTTPTDVDFLSGDAGNDTLVESSSEDRYGFEPGWGQDTITGDGDQPDAQPDGDGLCFACSANFVTTDLTINLVTGRAFETAAGRTGTNTVTWDTTNEPFIENATGGSGADTIKGSTRTNFVDGFNGGDTIDVADGGGFDRVECGGGSSGDGAADTVTMDAGADFATSSCTGDPNDQVTTVP